MSGSPAIKRFPRMSKVYLDGVAPRFPAETQMLNLVYLACYPHSPLIWNMAAHSGGHWFMQYDSANWFIRTALTNELTGLPTSDKYQWEHSFIIEAKRLRKIVVNFPKVKPNIYNLPFGLERSIAFYANEAVSDGALRLLCLTMLMAFGVFATDGKLSIAVQHVDIEGYDKVHTWLPTERQIIECLFAG